MECPLSFVGEAVCQHMLLPAVRGGIWRLGVLRPRLKLKVSNPGNRVLVRALGSRLANKPATVTVFQKNDFRIQTSGVRKY